MKNLAIFLAGLAIGAAATWKLTSDKYNKLIDDEINSVKETFKKYRDEKKEEQPQVKEEVKLIDKNSVTKDLKMYNNIVKKHNYAEPTPPIKEIKKDRPYVISPEEFGEKDGYEMISLTYYADCILCDDQDDIIENVEFVVGESSLDTFGMYEDDSVFVRNDTLKADYEILKDERNFEDL